MERCNRLLVDEVLDTRSYVGELALRSAIGTWDITTSTTAPHTACGDKPSASGVPARVN